MHNLTQKEIEIIYGYLYKVEPFTKYVKGYGQANVIKEYDVREDVDCIWIYHAGTSGYKVPVSRALELTL